MKTRTIITDITHDDLVNLFSTALYGSSWCGCNYDSFEYHSLPNESDNDCIEDKLAKLLLAGKTIELYDMYAEDSDDVYGKLPHHWDVEDETMNYTISLKDIKAGLQKALKSNYASNYVLHLANEDGEFDYVEANTLIQFIMFGEEIYA